MDISVDEKTLENIDLENMEYDMVNSFDKYYNLDRILTAMNKYEQKEISVRYLAEWANVYNWILMSGFCDIANKKAQFMDERQFLKYEISWSLDSLSFIHIHEGSSAKEEENEHLKQNRNFLVAADTILNNLDLFNCEYVSAGYNDGDIIFLATDHKNRQFIYFGGEFRTDYEEVTIPRVNLAKEMYIKIQNLIADGYKILYKSEFLEEEDFIDFQMD